MFAAVGNRVVTLHRAAIGTLTLGDLPPGQWRTLAPAELPAPVPAQPPPGSPGAMDDS